VKLGTTVDRHGIAGLRQCMADLQLSRGWVVCHAKERRQLGGGIEVNPWDQVRNGVTALDL
jgi:hypothetical protein